MLTMLPWFPRHPNLACTNEATPRGESPEAIRPDPDGHPAEKPTATRPRLRGHDRARTRSHTRARTRSHTRGFTQRRHPHVADAVPDWLEARNPGVLASGWSRLSALGPKTWEERYKQTVNITRRRTIGRRRRTRRGRRQDERNILSSLCFRTFRCHYVSPEYYTAIIRFGNTFGRTSHFPALPPVARAPPETYVFKCTYASRLSESAPRE